MTNIQTKSTKIVDEFLASDFVYSASLFFGAITKVLMVLVPAGVGGYFIINFNDNLVIAAGVGLALFALIKLVNIAYVAQVKTTKKRR